MNKNELRNTILSQIQLPCIGKNRMQVEPVSGQMQTRQLQQAIDDLSWRGGGTLVLQPGVYRTGALHLKNGVELHLASEDTLVQFVPDDPAENYPLVFSHWEARPCMPVMHRTLPLPARGCWTAAPMQTTGGTGIIRWRPPGLKTSRTCSLPTAEPCAA